MVSLSPDNGLVLVPTLQSAFRCGFDPTYSDGYDFEFIPRDCVNNVREPYVIKIVGDSMEPELREGDKLVIDVNKEPRHKNIVAVSLNGELMVKRLVINHFSTFLHSDNIKYQQYKIKEIDDFRILGVAVNLYRSI